MIMRPYHPSDREALRRVILSNTPRFIAPAEEDLYMSFLNRVERQARGEQAARAGQDASAGQPTRTVPPTQWRYEVLVHPELGVIGGAGMSVDVESGTATLCWGLIHANCHKEGMGKIMLEARLSWARENPAVRQVVLDTSQYTEGFFRRYGFVTTRVVPDHYAPGLHRHDMLLSLTPAGERAAQQ